MVLNMNYSLLMEGANSRYKIPRYINIKDDTLLSGTYLMRSIAEFNGVMREVEFGLSDISGEISLNEAFSIKGIADGIVELIKKAIRGIVKLKDKIIAIAEKVIKAVKDFITNRKSNFEKKYTIHKRMAMLQKAIKNADEPPVVKIGKLVPSLELMNDKFPNSDIIESSFIRLISDNANYCSSNAFARMSNAVDMSIDSKASAKLLENIEAEKDNIYGRVFGKYSYDPTNITQSAMEAAKQAFGDTSQVEDVPLTKELYSQADDNLNSNLEDIVKGLEKELDKFKKNYNGIIEDLETAENNVLSINKVVDKNKDKLIDFNKNYHDQANAIAINISNVLNIINGAIVANTILFQGKLNACRKILADSNNVVTYANNLIQKYYNIGDPNKKEIVNTSSEVQEFYNMQDEFDSYIVMLDELMIENSYNESVVNILLEAEGDAPDAGGEAKPENAAPQSGEQPAQQQNKQPGKLAQMGSNIWEYITNLFTKFANILTRFKQRIQEFIIQNFSTWWNNNKGNVQNLNLSDTTVNQWYEYNLDRFKISSVVPFDDTTAEALKKDESTQSLIMKTINGGTPVNETELKFTKDDSFGQKLTKLYQGNYINNENEGKQLGQTSFDAGKVWNFVDDLVVQGFNGEYLKQINDDYKKLDESVKKLKSSYEMLAEKYKETPEEKNENDAEKATQTQESAVENDFKFNLAEYFGLMEANIVAGPETQQSAIDNGSANPGGSKGKNKTLDGMIKRYTVCNTTAITSRMTNILAAFKQYVGLYKSVYKAPEKKENNAQNNEQQQPKGEQK